MHPKLEYKPRERQVGGTYIEHALTLRNFMAEFGGDTTWEELEQRLPGVLAAVNAERMTSYKYDKGETFYCSSFSTIRVPDSIDMADRHM